jgi:hypothetical protein
MTLLVLMTPAYQAESVAATSVPHAIDHLVYVVPDLEAGINEIERLLGVRPVVGGRHPDFGTHNALVALGATTYLEIIAADPGLERPGRGRLFGLDYPDDARLVTWALRSQNLETLLKRAASGGVELGHIASGSRERPDGEVLSWRLSDPYADRLGGAIPFLIDWGATPHPASSIPHAGVLLDLKIEHPDAAAVQSALGSLGVEVAVTKGPQVRIAARIRTAAGDVEIR